MQTGVGSTQGITDTCPERGIYREGLGGIKSHKCELKQKMPKKYALKEN